MFCGDTTTNASAPSTSPAPMAPVLRKGVASPQSICFMMRGTPLRESGTPCGGGGGPPGARGPGWAGLGSGGVGVLAGCVAGAPQVTRLGITGSDAHTME